MRRRPFTGWDAVVLAALLALNLSFLRRGREPPRALEITSDAGQQVVPLEPPRRLEVTGPLGRTTIQVDRDGARFLSSPCPNQLCVRTGAVGRTGEVAACLPNRVAVRLVRAEAATDEEAVDAVAR